MNNSYQRIKEHIFNNLKNQPSPLPDDQIKKEISTCRHLMTIIGLDNFKNFLPNKTELTELSETDWVRIERELETMFDVKMDLGILIKDESQVDRDPNWWSSKYKQSSDNYYWQRYKTLMSKSLTDGVVKTIDNDTDIIMDNLENPLEDSFSRYGMVVGHVQSGKTGNYSALICKAADAGYNFIVVIAGGMNNLRDQTQQRLNESFIGQDMGLQVGVGIGSFDRQKLPISLTTKEKDFNKQDADQNSQSLNFDNIKVPILLVIKKNTRTLNNVINWLQKQYKNKITNHSMLLIDDESDYASINTNEEEDPTTINKRIRKLKSLFQKSVYVAYTATPYANIFIDHQVGHNELGKDLFPKDFIYALAVPGNYFGAEKIFIKSKGRHLIPIKDYLDVLPANHKKNHQFQTLPETLKDAIRHFLLNIAIRHLRGQTSEHNSMLVHASRFTSMHQGISMHIDNYLEHLKKDVTVYGLLRTALIQSNSIADLKATFDKRILESEFEWEKVISFLTKIISTVVVREVHQITTVPLVYRKDMPTNAIVIGGTSLSRGYTLEGLSISYFLRNTLFYDTLMQMGRWFGYRPGYEDLCKIYLPGPSIDHFRQIIEATNDLIDDFKRMAAAKMTPSDFGLAVKHHPDSGLQVTARNKQKNAKDVYFDMKLDGHVKETAWLSIDEKKLANNLNQIRLIIENISSNTVPERLGNRYLWRDINKSKILEFLRFFDIYGSEDELGVRTRMPIKFIVEYIKVTSTDWDVALFSGTGEKYTILDTVIIQKEQRKIVQKHDYYEVQNRQVATGGAEKILLNKSERKLIGKESKDIRTYMKKPLLMLHILENKLPYKPNENSIAAFGVSFPGGIKSQNQTIKLKINTVYLDKLKEQFEDDDYDD